MTATATTAAEKSVASEEDAAYAFVQAVESAIAALEAIRSRTVGKKDATAATGHMLEAVLAAGGSLRDYDTSKIWALRHAIGGESFSFKSVHDAAVVVLSVVVQGLRPAASPEEEARKQTARGEIEAIARRLTQCENSVESIRAVEEHERGKVAAKAAADRAAHEARLAGGRVVQVSAPPKPAPAVAPTAAAKSASKKTAPVPEGDFPLPGSVEAGADPFPTTKVG